jgi:cysteine desulfurase
MVYLDYSATTPTNKEVLDTFVRVSNDFIGNTNSLHQLGVKAKELEMLSTKQIASLLHVKEKEIIYTSGASESNNFALKGICLKYKNRGKKILTTSLEHSSIYGPISYLQKLGFVVDFLETDTNGVVKLSSLEEKTTEDTILVSITAVNSETGVLEPIEEVGMFLKKYPKCFFHVDATQSIGKVNLSFENVDLISFSAHKIYGIKGIGCLIKKENVELEPLIHGGKSTTKYRSGTPAHPLIASCAKALRLAIMDLEKNYKYVSDLNKIIRENLETYEDVFINSTNSSIPHILNISVLFMKSETLLHALEEKEIFVSTQSACATGEMSKAVYAITKDEERAKHSVRISLSAQTTKEEVNYFLNCFKEIYTKYKNLKR